MRLRLALPVLSLLMLVAADAPAPKSPAAAGAIAKSDAAIKRAEEQFRAAKMAALKQLVIDLKAAMNLATKAGNLDEANSIKAAIDKAQADADAMSSEGKALRFTVKAGPEWTPTIEVRSGQVLNLSTSGRWCADPGRRDLYTFGAEGERAGKWFGLTGRIGDGPSFQIGAASSIQCDGDGMLSLCLGGGDVRTDDEGALAVSITPRTAP